MINLLKYFTHEELQTIINIKDLYLRASAVIDVLFKDKVDKSGLPYVGHLYRVSSKLSDSYEKVAGLLHDTLEDTDLKEGDLLYLGFPFEIVNIVKLLTHEDIDTTNMSREEKLDLYSKGIDKIISSGNIHAIRVKEADMSDNYNEDRLKNLDREKQVWFEEKYGNQLIKLRKAKGEIK